MMVLAEDDMQITLPAGITGRRFDDETSHGLSHCMKAVDFIIELEDRTIFIEFKDPENPKAKKKDSNAFLKKFLSGTIDTDLKTKYRDSWLYEHADGRAKKPIYYWVLIGASTLSDAELLARTDALKRLIPMSGPDDRSWKKPFIAGCAVMNLAAWNKALGHMPASRVGP
ncbi:hypothetical protein [Zavarzinia aquatilis]|uniref:hypothetical protein n=1 Tax=Zavarzinia aquatilis TaxID=2211142 RepID=UPI0010575FFD|nr:hypothetical protein [Zavarzinia aquatilis]